MLTFCPISAAERGGKNPIAHVHAMVRRTILPAMPAPTLPTLGARLADARHARYVGREAERARFAEAFAAAEPAFHVAHVYGPGGIGKTALLDEVARLAGAAGLHVGRVDGRDLDASPEAFRGAAEAALAGAADGMRRVLLVDTYERIEGLDEWLRRRFAPELRATDLLVLAGRHRPSAEWRARWGGEVAVVPLRNLAPAEARAYLDARGVPESAHGRILGFTHGHPLALTLAAERLLQAGADAEAFDPSAAPDLLLDLVTRFVSGVPSAAHRAALEGASVARSVTVPLLRRLLGAAPEAPEPAPDPDALFDWLRGLTFTESDATGVRLHDAVREAVEADLRWRDPAAHEAFHRAARRAYGLRLRRALGPAARHQALADYADLYRTHPLAGPMLRRLREAWAEADLDGSGPLRPGDAEAIAALVRRHEPAAEADAVAHWAGARPEGFEVFVGADGGVAGFLLTLPLDPDDPIDAEADPVAAAAWARVAPRLRPGERGLLFRSWMDAAAHQGVSVVQSLVFARTVERYLTTEGLAASVLLTAAPELWAPVLAFAGLHRWPEAEAGGAAPAAFGKDWRETPPGAWLDALAERTPSDAPAAPDPADALVVLSEDAFGDAVRDALKAYARPHRLAANPLLRARLVRDRLVRDGGGDPVEALRALIADAAAMLQDGPRDRPYHDALDATYLSPAPTQALAAERLDLPFSTYRRHLGRGVEHVAAALWRLETRA